MMNTQPSMSSSTKIAAVIAVISLIAVLVLCYPLNVQSIIVTVVMIGAVFMMLRDFIYGYRYDRWLKKFADDLGLGYPHKGKQK